MSASGSRSVATNSTSGATPIVPKTLRLIELKKVLVNSGSGCSVIRAAKAPPERALERARAEPLAQFRDRLVHEALVEPDALDGVLLARAQVAAVEAQRRAARDGAELRVVTGERLDGVAGALLSQGGGELVGGGHQRLAGLSRSRSAGRGSSGAGTAARSAAPARAPWTARGALAPERRPPHRSRGSPGVRRR